MQFLQVNCNDTRLMEVEISYEEGTYLVEQLDKGLVVNATLTAGPPSKLFITY